jgi:hypothetical protein
MRSEPGHKQAFPGLDLERVLSDIDVELSFQDVE